VENRRPCWSRRCAQGAAETARLRLVITGGGTGGHIYPALEVGRHAAERGHELLYFGSIRGQESKACAERDIPFSGFPSEPLYSLKTLRGLKALIRLQQARVMARKALRIRTPDVVFSTGGYSAGPVVAAARDLKIPYVIHSSDSIPARSSSLFAKQAAAFTCTFNATVDYMEEIEVIRTGQPIRRELRSAAFGKPDGEALVLVIGGSQGSQYLNQTVPKAAATDGFQAQVLHACGPAHLESTQKLIEKLNLADRYFVVPYLDTGHLAAAYRRAMVVVSRSGGTLAELAMFGLPSVLVPLPSSANNHQLHNATEFVNMNAATLFRQSDAAPSLMAEAVMGWIEHPGRRENARRNLHGWDIPDSTERIYNLIRRAAK